jgi:endonuclease/exonuclease/phosphatase (EEP) superfamily protein YafD
MTVEAPTAPAPAASIGHRHSRRKRRLPLWITVGLWIVVGALAVVAVARIVAWDSLDTFAILNSVTAVVYLPAWIVAVVAVLGRRYVLAGAALLVVGAQIAFVTPELTAAQPVPGWAATAPTIRLFDANVYDRNPSMSGYTREIKQYRPQLLTLEEAVPGDVTQLKRNGALAGLPYTVQIRRDDPWAFLIASKYPLIEVRTDQLFGQALIVETVVDLPSGPRSLWVVHTTGPVPQSFTTWKGQLAEINRQLRRRGTANLLLVGDFNATWNNKGFRQILDTGMTDGAAARARPFQMTWSQIEPILPPVVRIDHVLTGSGVAVTTISTNDGPGSDHRDVQATVAFRH